MRLEQGRTGKEENMKVLILEDGSGNHLHLSQKRFSPSWIRLFVHSTREGARTELLSTSVIKTS